MQAFGSPVWVSVGSADRLAYCQALGAAGGVVRNQNLDALEGLGPFDVILDPVGPAMVNSTSNCWPVTGAG